QAWVAELQGAPAGCVSRVNYHYRVAGTHGGDHLSPVWLSNLFVREDLRGMGLGGQLIDTVILYAERLGYRELWLSADEYTSFYQKRGWQVARLTRLGGRQVNIMKRELNRSSSAI